MSVLLSQLNPAARALCKTQIKAVLDFLEKEYSPITTWRCWGELQRDAANDLEELEGMEYMECLCGKKMFKLGKIVMAQKLVGNITVWACPPDGCGRLYLEGSPHGTWYLPEKNDDSNSFG